eukprot:2103445-Rhodomonas_salina.1
MGHEVLTYVDVVEEWGQVTLAPLVTQAGTRVLLAVTVLLLLLLVVVLVPGHSAGPGSLPGSARYRDFETGAPRGRNSYHHGTQ